MGGWDREVRSLRGTASHSSRRRCRLARSKRVFHRVRVGEARAPGRPGTGRNHVPTCGARTPRGRSRCGRLDPSRVPVRDPGRAGQGEPPAPATAPSVSERATSSQKARGRPRRRPASVLDDDTWSTGTARAASCREEGEESRPTHSGRCARARGERAAQIRRSTRAARRRSARCRPSRCGSTRWRAASPRDRARRAAGARSAARPTPARRTCR